VGAKFAAWGGGNEKIVAPQIPLSSPLKLVVTKSDLRHFQSWHSNTPMVVFDWQSSSCYSDQCHNMYRIKIIAFAHGNGLFFSIDCSVFRHNFTQWNNNVSLSGYATCL